MEETRGLVVQEEDLKASIPIITLIGQILLPAMRGEEKATGIREVLGARCEIE